MRLRERGQIGSEPSLLGILQSYSKRKGPFAFGKVRREGARSLWAAVTAVALEDILYGAASELDIQEWMSTWVGDAMAVGCGIEKSQLEHAMRSLAAMYRGALHGAARISDTRRRYYTAYCLVAKKLGISPVRYERWSRLVAISNPHWFGKSNAGRPADD